MGTQPDTRMEHEGRISTLEANVKHLQDSMDKLIVEVCSIRKALWVLCGVLLTGPAKEVIQQLLR